jgi:lipoic acid synthetase
MEGHGFGQKPFAVKKKVNPQTSIEALIPDFWGKPELIQKVIEAKPEVISHNLETVERLTLKIRSGAQYQRSLDVLKTIADSGIVAKSGIMLGIGEKHEEVLQTLQDMRKHGVKVVTIGQYLQPQRYLMPVKEYITPAQFGKYKEIGEQMGFSFVESSPLVRSSYRAGKHFLA